MTARSITPTRARAATVTDRPVPVRRPHLLHDSAIVAALTLLLSALWMLTHRYGGFDNDGKLYAVQAFVKLHPQLNTDFFLQYLAQGGYTIFPALYGMCVRGLGLLPASLILTVLFTAAFIASAWYIAQWRYGFNASWCAAATLLLNLDGYGAYDVFHVVDTSLTARLPAEALIMTALALQARGRAGWAVATGLISLCLHPLMAFPGLLLLLFQYLKPSQMLGVALACALGALLVCVAAADIPGFGSLSMDAVWVELVRERSQYLFASLWTLTDWSVNLRPILCLLLMARMDRSPSRRGWYLSAMLVGVLGLLLHSFASALTPVSILLQCQPWRWMWITTTVCLLSLVPTCIKLWREDVTGPTLALLLLGSWLIPPFAGLLCIASALVLSYLPAAVAPPAVRYIKWGSWCALCLIALWSLINAWTEAHAPFDTGREPLWLQALRNVFAYPFLVIFIIWQMPRMLSGSHSLSIPCSAAVALLLLNATIAPHALKPPSSIGSRAQIKEFADWRSVIPPTGTVFIVGGEDPGSFVWFTLERPNYLALPQSAGVVFSRAAAMEVRRRSEVLIPLVAPEWQLLTQWRRREHALSVTPAAPPQPFTAAALQSVCRDPLLGFVIAKEEIALNPLQHRQSGPWKDWNLYDCNHLRSTMRPTA